MKPNLSANKTWQNCVGSNVSENRTVFTRPQQWLTLAHKPFKYVTTEPRLRCMYFRIQQNRSTGYRGFQKSKYELVFLLHFQRSVLSIGLHTRPGLTSSTWFPHKIWAQEALFDVQKNFHYITRPISILPHSYTVSTSVLNYNKLLWRLINICTLGKAWSEA
jgi:hypothetical protein